MSVQTISTTVDGHTIDVVQFVPTRGFRIKARLIKLILPAIGALLGESGKVTGKTVASFLDSDANLGAAFTQLASSLDDPEALLQLLLDLLSSTKIDGKDFTNEKIFNELFVANYMLAYKVAWEVIKANGFFELGGIGNLLSSGLPKTQVS